MNFLFTRRCNDNYEVDYCGFSVACDQPFKSHCDEKQAENENDKKLIAMAEMMNELEWTANEKKFERFFVHIKKKNQSSIRKKKCDVH